MCRCRCFRAPSTTMVIRAQGREGLRETPCRCNNARLDILKMCVAWGRTWVMHPSFELYCQLFVFLTSIWFSGSILTKFVVFLWGISCYSKNVDVFTAFLISEGSCWKLLLQGGVGWGWGIRKNYKLPLP